MVCPTCSGQSRVLESRSAEGGTAVRRRRECTACGRRFTTFERHEMGRLHVQKRDGERQRFDREKLRASLLGAAHKRDVSRSEIDAIVARVAAEVESAGGELPAARIGELCLEALRELDWGAYLQFMGTLPEPNADFAAAGALSSVRVPREDAESTPTAASRRGSDE